MHSVCNLQGALLQVPKDGTPRQLTVLEVGRAIRNPAGPFWKHGMLLALSDAILRSIIEQLGLGSKPASSQFASDLQYFYGQHEQLEQVADMLIAGSSSPLISSNSLAAVVRSTCAELSQKQLSFQRELSAMETILESIEVFGLEDCCSMKPMVAGEKLKEVTFTRDRHNKIFLFFTSCCFYGIIDFPFSHWAIIWQGSSFYLI